MGKRARAPSRPLLTGPQVAMDSMDENMFFDTLARQRLKQTRHHRSLYVHVFVSLFFLYMCAGRKRSRVQHTVTAQFRLRKCVMSYL